jgi:hypothetical protein
MQAPESIEIVESTETPAPGACLLSGCTCKDARIISYRRAAFFADVARRMGQTADRIIAVEPAWRFPAADVSPLAQR